MMSDTTYMTGKEAVEKGFANELLDDAEPVEISASADRQTIYAKGHALHLRPGTKLPGNIPMAKAAAPATATANTPGGTRRPVQRRRTYHYGNYHRGASQGKPGAVPPA